MVDIPLSLTLKTFSSEKRWFCCWADILVEFVRVCWMGAAVCKGSGSDGRFRMLLGTAMALNEGRKEQNFLTLYGENSFDWRGRILSAFMCRSVLSSIRWCWAGCHSYLMVVQCWSTSCMSRHTKGISSGEGMVRLRFKILTCFVLVSVVLLCMTSKGCHPC